jgi:hypothetical protein
VSPANIIARAWRAAPGITVSCRGDEASTTAHCPPASAREKAYCPGPGGKRGWQAFRRVRGLVDDHRDLIELDSEHVVEGGREPSVLLAVTATVPLLPTLGKADPYCWA